MSKRKYIFFHCYAPPASPKEHWQAVTRECFAYLIGSGLYNEATKVIVGMNCPNGYGEQWLRDYFKQYAKVAIKDVAHRQHAVEWTTLRLLKEMAPEYDQCLYMHTKNASRAPGVPNFELNEKWRQFMLNIYVRKWRECVPHLETHDIVGCSWFAGTHFHGNFWWANSEHIQRLPHPQQLFTDEAVKRKWLNRERLNISVTQTIGNWTKKDWEMRELRYVAEAYTYLSEPGPKYKDMTPGLVLWRGDYDLNKYL